MPGTKINDLIGFIKKLFFSLGLVGICLTGVIILILNPHSFILFVGMLSSLSLGCFVYFKSPTNLINRTFFILSLSIGVWYLELFGLCFASTEKVAENWLNAFGWGLKLIPPAMLHFVYAFTGKIEERGIEKIIFCAYGISLGFIILQLMGYYSPGFYRTDVQLLPRMGYVYFCFIVYLIITITAGFVDLFRRYFFSRSLIERARLKYILMGGILTFIFGLFNLLPEFTGVYPIGNLSALFFVGFISYAIIKHGALNIEVLLNKWILYVILTGLIVGIYAVVVGITILLLGELHPSFSLIWLYALIAAIITICFQPLKEFLQQIIDRLLFVERYSFISTLKDLTKELTSIVDKQELIRLIVQKTIKITKAKSSFIYVLNEADKCFELVFFKGIKSPTKNEKISAKDPIIKYLKLRSAPLKRDEIEDERFKEWLERMDTIILIPLIVKERIIGIFGIGPKLTGKTFNQEEIELLSVLCSNAAVALENAMLLSDIANSHKELKGVYRKLKGMQNKLIQSEHFALAGKIASEIAHEIRNPLSIINLSAHFIGINLPKEHKVLSEHIDKIKRSIKKAERIVNDFMDVSKPMEFGFSPVDLKDIVEDVLEEQKYLISNIKIIKDFNNSPPINGDYSKLKTAFTNIIVNAIEAMPDGGQLKISIYPEEKRTDKSKKTVIDFQDTGCGIPEKDRSSIFKLFYTTKSKGVGLGLSIVKKILDAHNALISVTSQPNKGTSFKIKFNIK